MAKSRLVQLNEKIADNVTSGFQKVSDTVIGAFTKIEDKFVDQYLTRENETVGEAKERLDRENQKRLRKNMKH